MKKSLIIKVLAGVLAVSALSTGAVLALKKAPPAAENEITAGHTAMAEPPADGSLPTDHGGTENLSYMAYNLRHAAAYRTEAYSTVETKVGFISYTQRVETYKDYADGVMICEDIAKSSLVNSAMQTCFADGRVLWRGPASGRAEDWQGKDTAWAESVPSNYSESEYMRIYGLPSTEFSVYVLNADTVRECSPVTDNGDGTYTQTFYPDTQTAGQYYVRRMKTMGSLSEYPSFNSIEITYTFDGAWNVLAARTVENYAVSMGVLRADNCTAVTEQTYFYGADGTDISDYEGFFSRYLDRQSEGEISQEREPSAADYLSAAFSPVLTGAVQFDVEAEIGDTPLSGKVYLDMGGSSLQLRAKFGDLSFWYEDGTVYAKIGRNVVRCAEETALGLLRAAFPGGDAFAGLDTEAILAQLSGGELQTEEGGALLVSHLEIAGMHLPLTFSFARADGAISLNYVALTDAKIGDKALSARLAYDTGAPLPALTAAEREAAVGLDAPLAALASSDGRAEVCGSLDFSVRGTDMTLYIPRLHIEWQNGPALYAEMKLAVAGTVHDVRLSCDANEICVAYGGIGMRVRADESERLAQAFAQAYEKIAAQRDAAAAAEGAAAERVVGLSALSALFSSEAFTSFLDSLRVYEEEDVLHAAFRLLSLDAALSYDGEKLSLSGSAPAWGCLSFRLTVQGGGAMGTMPSGTDYLTADELCLLCDYAVELFAISQRTEWNIGYTMTVNNGENGNVYDVDGRVQIVAAQEERPFAASLDLAAVPADGAGKSYYLSFTVDAGKVYIVVSYYRDGAAGQAAYDPLRLEGELSSVSRMLRSLGALLGEDGSFLQTLSAPFLSAAEGGGVGAAGSFGEIFRSVFVDGQAIVLTLAPDALRGGTESDWLTATLSRADADGNFSLSLENLRLGNIRLDGCLQTVSTPCAVSPEEGEYIDFSSVEGLLDGMIGSFLDLSDGKAQLLEDYYFGGTITGGIGGMNVSFDVALRLHLCGDSPTVCASVAAESKFAVNGGAYKTYITIDLSTGMIYMEREQYEYYRLFGFRKYDTPVRTSREMTAAQFAADYWGQIVYITNMGDTLASVVQKLIDGSTAEPPAAADVGSYLQSYACADGVYSLTLNGSVFADFLGDMTLLITCDDVGRVVRIAGSVDIYVELSFALEYENVTRPEGDYSLPAAPFAAAA